MSETKKTAKRYKRTKTQDELQSLLLDIIFENRDVEEVRNYTLSLDQARAVRQHGLVDDLTQYQNAKNGLSRALMHAKASVRRIRVAGTTEERDALRVKFAEEHSSLTRRSAEIETAIREMTREKQEQERLVRTLERQLTQADEAYEQLTENLSEEAQHEVQLLQRAAKSAKQSFAEARGARKHLSSLLEDDSSLQRWAEARAKGDRQFSIDAKDRTVEVPRFPGAKFFIRNNTLDFVLRSGLDQVREVVESELQAATEKFNRYAPDMDELQLAQKQVAEDWVDSLRSIATAKGLL